MQFLMGMFNSMKEVERLECEIEALHSEVAYWKKQAQQWHNISHGRDRQAVQLKDFAAFVDLLYVKQRDVCDGLLHPAIGMAGEAGEVLDLVKKSWAYGKPLDRGKLIEEMGDLYHYMTMMMIVMDIELGDLIENNTAKLKKRYPDGYSDQAAIERKDKA